MCRQSRPLYQGSYYEAQRASSGGPTIPNFHTSLSYKEICMNGRLRRRPPAAVAAQRRLRRRPAAVLRRPAAVLRRPAAVQRRSCGGPAAVACGRPAATLCGRPAAATCGCPAAAAVTNPFVAHAAHLRSRAPLTTRASSASPRCSSPARAFGAAHHVRSLCAPQRLFTLTLPRRRVCENLSSLTVLTCGRPAATCGGSQR